MIKIKSLILSTLMFCGTAFLLVACAGPGQIIDDPLRELKADSSPAIIIKDRYTYFYETVRCASTQQFLVTESPFSLFPPDRAIKFDLKALAPAQSQPKERKIFSVFFPINSCAIDPHESERLSGFIDEIKNNPAGPVSVTGYTCRLGPLEYNRKLALNRAKAVAEILQKAGIPVGSVIGKVGCCYIDSSNPAPNRRVEIEVPSEKGTSENINQEGGDS